jgi:hypothetical protein
MRRLRNGLIGKRRGLGTKLAKKSDRATLASVATVGRAIDQVEAVLWESGST